MKSAAPRTSSGKILQNSFWYGLEQILELVIFLSTSIVVARAFGPAKLGYFGYINLFVSVITTTGGSGLATATRKYMSEFIATERLGLARSVYRFTYRYQLLGATVIALVGVLGIWLFGEPQFRWMSTLLVLSIVPGVMSWVPAQANVAFEDLSKNTISALGYLGSYAVVIVLTLHFHWDLAGIAAATLVGRSVEMVMRTIPLHAKLRTLGEEPLPQEIAARIRRFCLQAMGIQLLMAVVWNRSELIFLRRYSTLEQMGFYSVATGLATKLLLVPKTFGGATGVTLMVECSRDPDRVESIVKNASRYLLLVAIPVHLGAAALTGQAIRFAYTDKYAGAIPALIVASLLSLPLAFQEIPETLLRAADRQKLLFRWLIITGILNMLLDWILIPRYAAVGAAWGNGLSQAFGLVAIWLQAQGAYRFSLPKRAASRLLAAGLGMAGVAFLISRNLAGLPGLVAAVLAAIPCYILLVKLLHGLEPSDRARLLPIGRRLPGAIGGAYAAIIGFVVPGGVTE
ncbi:MAG: polysaccharide biosynthesis C-terminal domain-containing protein [Acidobacteriota bacterium]|nr:polysaccharide biosynthesis C-terminal domain-containing protein [Acidobacteriota bacterium]